MVEFILSISWKWQLALWLLVVILYNFEQIHSHRPAYSWLPWWIIHSRTWFPCFERFPLLHNLDGFHVSLWGARILTGCIFAINAVQSIYEPGIVTHRLWLPVNEWVAFTALTTAWFIFSIALFPLFYHYLFMRRAWWGIKI